MDLTNIPSTATHVADGGSVSGRSTAPLRVLVVGVAWPMEPFVERLVLGLAASGVQVSLMSAGRPDASWLAESGIDWSFGPKRLSRSEIAPQIRRNGLRPTLSAVVRRLGKRLASFAGSRAELIASDVIYAPWINALIDHTDLQEAGLPVVTSCRGSFVTTAPWNPTRTGHREALPRVFDAARIVHCVSDSITADAVALGLDPAKARVIRPAVDPRQFAPRPGPRPSGPPTRAIGVGGLNWNKDYEHALVAIRKAVDAGADLRFDLIGEGADRQHLVFTIDDLGLTDRVRLLGRCTPTQIAHELQHADVFLHTSSSEGISNAVLEAMASGLPIVTTEAGGMREAVRDGIDGLIVKVRDTEATAAALTRLASDAALRSRMGASARARIEADFRLDQQIAAFRDMFYEAAGR